MRKTSLVILFLGVVATSFAVAEDGFSFVEDKSVGFSCLATYDCYNSLGMSYQQWFAHGIGLQVTVGGGFAKYNMNSLFSVQADLQKLFFAHRFNRSEITTALFGWLAGGFTCYEDDYTEFMYDEAGDSYNEIYHEEFVKAFGLGLGLGVDVIFSDHVSIPVTMGFMGSYSDEVRVHFCMGSGLRYRF